MGGYLYLLFMILIYIILLFVAHASNHTRMYLWNYVSLMTQLCFDTSTRIVRIVDPSISCRLIAGGRFDHWSTSRRVFTNESISTTFPYTRYKYKYKRSELNRFLYRYRYVISGNFFDRIFFLHECIVYRWRNLMEAVYILEYIVVSLIFIVLVPLLLSLRTDDQNGNISGAHGKWYCIKG